MGTNEKRVVRKTTKKFVRLGQMAIPPMAQRELNQHKVDELLSNFDPDELGFPVLSFRMGVYYVIDGQHRIETVKRWLGDGWKDQRIECDVYEGLTEAEEAEKFLQRNNTLTVSVFDKFKISVNAGREVEVRIRDLVESENLCISRDKTPGSIAAVGTLRRVYVRSTEEAFIKTLQIIRDAFGDAGFESQILDGVGHLCQRYNGILNKAVATQRLKEMNGGVKGLLNKARKIHDQRGGVLAHCVAAAAVEQINAKKGGKKLPSWWKAE